MRRCCVSVNMVTAKQSLFKKGHNPLLISYHSALRPSHKQLTVNVFIHLFGIHLFLHLSDVKKCSVVNIIHPIQTYSIG